MRLVTYDRGGARRLGAWVEQTVVDVPDAVGHPAFPRTMEALVARNGGTTLDAARNAIALPELIEECRVVRPRLLVPFKPDGVRERVHGPNDEVGWPRHDTYLDHNVQLACILGRDGVRLSRSKAARAIFGYTLMVTWISPSRGRQPVALSFGPSVVTADEFDPSGLVMTSRIDGKVASEVGLSPAAWTFPEMVVAKSRAARGVRPGVVLASTLSRRGVGLGIPLEPGSLVEVEGPGIGVLRNQLGSPATGAGSGHGDGHAAGHGA